MKNYPTEDPLVSTTLATDTNFSTTEEYDYTSPDNETTFDSSIEFNSGETASLNTLFTRDYTYTSHRFNGTENDNETSSSYSTNDSSVTAVSMSYSTNNQTMVTAINASSTLSLSSLASTTTNSVNATLNVTASGSNTTVSGNDTSDVTTFTPSINSSSKPLTASAGSFNTTELSTANETLHPTTIRPENVSSIGSVGPSSQTAVSFTPSAITITSVTMSNETNPNQTTRKYQTSKSTSGGMTGNPEQIDFLNFENRNKN